MATKDEHVAKADNNAAFAKALELKSQVNIDWALVCSCTAKCWVDVEKGQRLILAA